MKEARNGKTETRIFKGEYKRRLAAIREAMSARDMDILFVEDPSNIAWITGYDGWSFYTHQGAIVFHDRDPVWWGRAQDAGGALRTVWMEDGNVMFYEDRYVQSTARHPMQDLAGKMPGFRMRRGTDRG